MKFMRICLLVCGLMLAFVGVTYASSFSVSADKYGKVEGNGIEFSFPENNKTIQIAFLTKDNERYLIAGKDGEPIYAAQIPNVKYVRVKQVYDTETGKYAYIISGSINSMGDSDLSLLMGYDEQKEAWQLYVNPINYYNPLGKYAEGYIYVENGELILAYSIISKHPKAQEYHFFWDENSNWFGYKDYGIVQH
ncbi:hypothetical protein INF25_04675 [Megamonas funiformis]|uniref:hypothetical protein n=1 Tax=Megamonas funiformis TaxID=437897 RepID=UPI0018748F1C|nr:hypothetical protein [Megamonas funiformis]MBE5060080.1 hypothetical protein [Megamonas funiformis]BDA09514.1 hypothetical protein MU1CBH_05420 [Megamonas funiformis]